MAFPAKLLTHTRPAAAESARGAALVGLAAAVPIALGSITRSRLLRGILVGAGVLVGSAGHAHARATSAREAQQELRELWGLTGLIGAQGRPLPAPGGWALGAAAVRSAAELIADCGYRTVVELGPGASSVLLGMACRPLQHEVRFFGVEHDADYAQRVAAQLRFHEVPCYTLIHAELVAQPVPGMSGLTRWYDPSRIAELPEQVDLLIVDGPPNWDASSARSPAWRLLRERMSPGSAIVVDDTSRADERAMVGRWLADPGLQILRDAGDFMILQLA